MTRITKRVRDEAILICDMTACGTGAALEVPRAAIGASREAIELALDTQGEINGCCDHPVLAHDADCWRVRWAEGAAMLRDGWSPT